MPSGDGRLTVPAPSGQAYRLGVLAILILVYTFNFIDRQIVGVLAPAIKAELHLSDTELGLMGGLAFALFYTGLGIPIAWLADRWSRTWVMTIALTVWSGFTALCGLAGSFPLLFAARMGVGIGEAGGVAPAYSLISDYFPPPQRARALAAYSFGIPIGSALGIVFGGVLANRIDWRAAFLIVGLCGVLLAPVLRLVVREPTRQLRQPRDAHLGRTLALLAAKPSFWLLSVGGALSSTFAYGASFWLPSFFGRSFHLGLEQIAVYYGAVVLVGGVAGVWGGGWIVDRFGQRNRAVYCLTPAIAFLIAVPCFLGALTSASLTTAFVLFLIPQALSLTWLGPIIAAIQHLAPAAQRTTASAAFLFVNNLIGLGAGALFFGAMSDLLRPHYGADSLKYAIIGGLGFYVLAAGLFLLAARRLSRDWVD
jgi:MFS family permease